MASEERSNVIVNSCSSVGKVLFSSDSFQDILFVFGLLQFEYDRLKYNFVLLVLTFYMVFLKIYFYFILF